MSKTRPRVVLVGAGGYGRLYVEALTSQDMGAELTAICDIDPNLAERVPQIRQRQIPVYPTLDAFFAKDSADLAVLVSPVHFQRRPCRAHHLCPGAWRERFVREAALPDRKGSRRHAGSQ